MDTADRDPDAEVRRTVGTLLAAPVGPWRRLPGGRTNVVWRVTTGRGPVVVKLGLPDRAAPLFPNDPAAEARCLKDLEDTGIAPRLLATIATTSGPCIMMEDIGRNRGVAPAALGALLRRVHGTPPPEGLRRLRLSGVEPGSDTSSGARPGTAHLSGDEPDPGAPAAYPATARRHHPLPPGPADRAVFLHGDPTPANVLWHDGRAKLVDWQCPAIGHPAFDLAIALDPGMAIVSGRTPFHPHEEAALLEAYGAAETTRAFRRLRPLLTRRLIHHAEWRIARGHHDYAAARAAGLALLERLDQEE